MSLPRLKWLTVFLPLTFLVVVEYVRHFVYPALLHFWPGYLLTFGTIALGVLLFSQSVFGILERTQQKVLQQNRQLATLNAIAGTVSRSLDLDETLNDALDKVVDITGVDAIAIHLLEGDRLSLESYRNLPPHFVEEVSEWPVGEGVTGRIAESGQPIVVQKGFSRDPRLTSEIVTQQGFESFAGVPLLSKGKAVGVMSMATYRQREFNAEDLELLTAIGNQIAVAIENARLYQESLKRARQLSARDRVLRVIASTLDIAQVYEAFAGELRSIVDFDRTSVILLDETGEQFEVALLVDPEGTQLGKGVRFPITASIALRRLIQRREPWLEADLSQAGQELGPVELQLREMGMRSTVMIPLMAAGRIIGSLNVGSQQPDVYTAAHLEDLVPIAEQLALAIEKRRLYEETLRLTMTDALTGLCNRRHFYQALERELARVDRYDQTVSLIMLDVDDFKAYNDTHGHLAGDDLLRDLAGILCGLARQVDTPARYGGEEFVLLLPETDKPGALALAERLRAAVAGHVFDLGRVTISAGVAVYPTDADTAEGLVNAADMALYQAKRARKNQVCLAEVMKNGV